MYRLLLALVLLLSSSVRVVAEECTTLIAFEIEDQFKEKHSESEFAGKTTILVWSDRESSKFASEWEEPLREALAEEIEAGTLHFRTVSHVKGVPFFVKGKVRGTFSKDRAAWSLLDWDGRFREAYAPAEEKVNVFVFDAEGCLVDQLAGVQLGDDDLQRFVAGIRSL